jgi:hypothetical protein
MPGFGGTDHRPAALDVPDPAAAETLLPKAGRHPYYVVAPAYRRSSIGIRCLHLLAHWLNRLGHGAWIVPYDKRPGLHIDPNLVTPELTPKILAWHNSQGLAPIAVYPEVVYGNPLRAGTVVRFLLNFPGVLGGDATVSSRDIVFGFSRVLAEVGGSPDNVLHMPVLDTEVFSPHPQVPRQGACHYLGKYRRDHGGEAFGLPPGSTQIASDPKAMDQKTIAAIFRRSELFYVYENTGLITEAGLCGCPSVMMPNRWLTAMIAQHELGSDGIAWGDSPDAIAEARRTVGHVRARYQQNVAAFFTQLDHFVSVTQARAAAERGTDPIHPIGLYRTAFVAPMTARMKNRMRRGRASH